MRQSILTQNSKEYVLDVTRSFAYDVHHQPKRITHPKPKDVIASLSRQIQGALRKLFISR